MLEKNDNEFHLLPTNISCKVKEIYNYTLYKATLDSIDTIDNKHHYQITHDNWLKLIQDDEVDVKDLVSLVSLLITRDIDKKGNIDKENKTKKMSRELKASREAIISEINRRNTKTITTTMTSLDEKASQLDQRASLVAIIGLILAITQFTTEIIIPFTNKRIITFDKNQKLYIEKKDDNIESKKKFIVDFNIF